MAKRLSPGFREGPLGHGPGFEHATDFKAQIVMEASSRVLLYDENFLVFVGFFAARLGRFLKNRRLRRYSASPGILIDYSAVTSGDVLGNGARYRGAVARRGITTGILGGRRHAQNRWPEGFTRLCTPAGDLTICAGGK